MLLDKCDENDGVDRGESTELPDELFQPLVEYIGLVIKTAGLEESQVEKSLEESQVEKSLEESQVIYIYHIIVKLHEIVASKCKKNGLKIDDADTLMDYMYILAKAITRSEMTRGLYKIMTRINSYFKKHEPSYYTDIGDIEMPRWLIFYSLLENVRSDIT